MGKRTASKHVRGRQCYRAHLRDLDKQSDLLEMSLVNFAGALQRKTVRFYWTRPAPKTRSLRVAFPNG